MRSLRVCVLHGGENGWWCEHHRAAVPALSNERETLCHEGSHTKLCQPKDMAMCFAYPNHIVLVVNLIKTERIDSPKSENSVVIYSAQRLWKSVDVL